MRFIIWSAIISTLDQVHCCHRRASRPVEILGIRVSPCISHVPSRYVWNSQLQSVIHQQDPLLKCARTSNDRKVTQVQIWTLTTPFFHPWDPTQFLSWACPCRNSANLPGTAPEGPQYTSDEARHVSKLSRPKEMSQNFQPSPFSFQMFPIIIPGVLPFRDPKWHVRGRHQNHNGICILDAVPQHHPVVHGSGFWPGWAGDQWIEGMPTLPASPLRCFKHLKWSGISMLISIVIPPYWRNLSTSRKQKMFELLKQALSRQLDSIAEGFLLAGITGRKESSCS